MPSGTHPGKLIIFEGPDGTGKTTLAQDLVRNLNGKGIKSVYVSFPGREQGGLGKIVYELHHRKPGRDGTPIHPVSNQLLHVAAHIDLIGKVIRPALASGSWVVLDRYWWSTRAYGKLSGASESALSLMIQIELEHWDPISPAALFLLRRKSLSAESPLPFEDDLAEQYEELARKVSSPNVVRLDTTKKSPSESLGEVLNAISQSDSHDGGSRSGATRKQGRPENSAISPYCFAKGRQPHASPVMDTYWRFAAERQKVFFSRLRGDGPPWTSDRVLQKHKFTNAYRASDRVSQFLIRQVIYDRKRETEDVIFRTLMFKLFNKVTTWELLNKECGEIDARNFSVERYSKVLNAALDRGEKIYSAAYIMPSGQSEQRKHHFHLNLLRRMLTERLPTKLESCKSLESVFDMLRSYPSLGPFLAFQYAIDLNYGPAINFTEMEFVVPGPGARDGIRKCFASLGDYSETDVIRLVADQQQESFERLGLQFQDLWGRKLHLIDCQNLFCEVDKYSRVAHPEYSGLTGRTKIKQIFRANSNAISYWYPPKWGINHRVECEVARYANI